MSIYLKTKIQSFLSKSSFQSDYFSIIKLTVGLVKLTVRNLEKSFVKSKKVLLLQRRDGRAVDCGGLENR
jgi:hypothetical protein